MTTILAHRANIKGPHTAVENSLEACARALKVGFGLETDLRRDARGQFYISHDAGARTPENSLAAFSKLFARFPSAELAINVKELGYEAALVKLMNSGRLGRRSFYFDFELLERKTPGAAQRKIRSLPKGATIRLASRISDRGETVEQCLAIPAEIVWADEFDRLWLTKRVVAAVRKSGRRLFVISPELHGFEHDARLRRWRDFKTWGVDGICTDFALEAREFFG